MTVGFAILIIATIFSGLKIVSQGSKHIVQKLGKFYKILSSGLNIIIPYIDIISNKITIKDIVLDIPS